MSIRSASIFKPFQSTPPSGERRRTPFLIAKKGTISIHAPERGATGTCNALAIAFSISIHAPERGATGKVKFRLFLIIISIHAPERGATFITCVGIRDISKFQSTPPSGERLVLGFIPTGASYISIHAPERGATSLFFGRYADYRNFNPRPRAGSDH